MFYSIVSTNSSSTGKWISVNDKDPVNNVINLSKKRLEKIDEDDTVENESIQYHHIYNTILQLRSSLVKTDVVDVIWVVPNLECKGKSQMAMEPDTNTAPFLYRSIASLRDLSSFVQITFLSAFSSNSLSIWSSLLNASVYYVSSLSVPHVPLPSNTTLVKANTSSLIIEVSRESYAPPTDTPSRLPAVENAYLYEVTISEMETVCVRLMAMNIEGRCQFCWQEVDHHFQSSLLERDCLAGKQQSVTASMIRVSKAVPFELGTDSTIQLLNKYSAVEMAQFLHILLSCSVEFSLILSHPQKNPMQSLFSSSKSYYSCCLVNPCDMKKSFSHKPSCRVYIGFVFLSSVSSSLFLIPSEDNSLSPLDFVIHQAIHHSSTDVILDSDIDSALLNTRVLNETKEEE